MLPVDILDYIFSYLDITSLEAISEAHSFFLSIAERYKYANVLLTLRKSLLSSSYNDSTVLTPVAFSRLLSKRPHISNHVLTVTIDIFTRDFAIIYGVVDPGGDNTFEAIPSILGLLRKLRKITIEHLTTEFSDVVKWPELPGHFFLSLENFLLSRPFVQDLRIKNIREIPLSLLHQCICIKHLTLERCTISDEDGSMVDSDSYHYDLPLKDLAVFDLPYSSFRKISHWMMQCSKDLRNLTSLKIGILYTDDQLYPSISPPSGHEICDLPHLEEASLHAQIYTDADGPINMRPLLVFTELSEIMPNLRRLSLNLILFVTSEDQSLDRLELDWSELDSFLDPYSRSARVVIDLCVGVGSLLDSTTWSDHATKTSVMGYPNIRKIVEQNTFIVSLTIRGPHNFLI